MPKIKEKKFPFVRINSRVKVDQLYFIKDQAKEKGISEGEMHRIIIDFYINSNNKL